MCCSRIFLASSMYGRFSVSDSAFHSAPSFLLSSELCILGFSCANSLRLSFDQTMNAFIGRLMWSGDLLDMIVIGGSLSVTGQPAGKRKREKTE